MGFVLQTETALEKCIIIIQTNLTVTFVTGTRHNMWSILGHSCTCGDSGSKDR